MISPDQLPSFKIEISWTIDNQCTSEATIYSIPHPQMATLIYGMNKNCGLSWNDVKKDASEHSDGMILKVNVTYCIYIFQKKFT